MSDDEKKPWNEKARERREQLQEEYQENDPVPAPQASSGYATRGSGALVSENMGPVEWSVGCVTFVDAAAQMAAASMAAAAHERDKIQMNNLGAPVDNEARGLISELGIMGNPFKVSGCTLAVWLSHVGRRCGLATMCMSRISGWSQQKTQRTIGTTTDRSRGA